MSGGKSGFFQWITLWKMWKNHKKSMFFMRLHRFQRDHGGRFTLSCAGGLVLVGFYRKTKVYIEKCEIDHRSGRKKREE